MESGFRFICNTNSYSTASTLVDNSSGLNDQQVLPGEMFYGQNNLYDMSRYPSDQLNGNSPSLFQDFNSLRQNISEYEATLFQGTHQQSCEIFSPGNQNAYSLSPQPTVNEFSDTQIRSSVGELNNAALPYLFPECGPNGTENSKPLSQQRAKIYRNMIEVSNPSRRRRSSSISVRIEGLYSPTKLIRKEFRTDKDLHQETSETKGGEMNRELSKNDSNMQIYTDLLDHLPISELFYFKPQLTPENNSITSEEANLHEDESRKSSNSDSSAEEHLMHEILHTDRIPYFKSHERSDNDWVSSHQANLYEDKSRKNSNSAAKEHLMNKTLHTDRIPYFKSHQTSDNDSISSQESNLHEDESRKNSNSDPVVREHLMNKDFPTARSISNLGVRGQPNDIHVFVVEVGHCGTIRLLKTFARNPNLKSPFGFGLSFKKNITRRGISFSMNVWHTQKLNEYAEDLKTCLRFSRSMIVPVYDVTEENCTLLISRLILVMKHFVSDGVPVYLIGNTSNVGKKSTVNASNKKRKRFMAFDYGVYLKKRHGLLAFNEISIESAANVDALFDDIVNRIFEYML